MLADGGKRAAFVFDFRYVNGLSHKQLVYLAAGVSSEAVTGNYFVVYSSELKQQYLLFTD